jgi:hypothetical protein
MSLSRGPLVGKRSSSQQRFSYDEAPVIFNSTLETNG